MPDNEEITVMSMSTPATTKHRRIKTFIEATEQDKAIDFELICDGHHWPIHSSLLKECSGYFRAMFNSGLKESQEGRIINEEQDPWDIARMIQFMYAGNFEHGDYDHRKRRNSTEMNLRPSLYFIKSGSNYVTGEARSRGDIELTMFEVAEFYDIPLLRKCVGQKMVKTLEQLPSHQLLIGQASQVFEINDLNELGMRFKQVYEALLPYLHDNEEMDRLESRLITIIFNIKRRDRFVTHITAPPFPILRRLRTTDEDKGVVQDFRTTMHSYAQNNPRFALKLAEMFEDTLDNGFSLIPHDKIEAEQSARNWFKRRFKQKG